MSSFAPLSAWPPEAVLAAPISFGDLVDPKEVLETASLDEGLAACPSDVSETDHLEAVRRVSSMYRACVEGMSSTDPVFLPGGEWREQLGQRRALYDAILDDRLSVAGEMLRSFWRNGLGPIVKEYASYEQARDGVEPRATKLLYRTARNALIWKRFVGGPMSALRVPEVGAPWGVTLTIDGERERVAPKACRHHALAAQAGELTRAGRYGDRRVVGEIGGGFGGMASYLLRDDPKVSYAGYDLAETLVIAAYWLVLALPGRAVSLYGEPEDSAATVRLLPSYELPREDPGSVDVMVNTFSLSEMPAATIDAMCAQIARVTSGWFLSHNMDREGVENLGHARTPSSRFPLDRKAWARVSSNLDLFHGHDGDYREDLYRRLPGGGAG